MSAAWRKLQKRSSCEKRHSEHLKRNNGYAFHDVDVWLRRCKSFAEKIQELQSPLSLLKPSYRYWMCYYPDCVLSGGATAANLHTCICYASNMHPWLNKTSASKQKTKNSGRCVNSVFISHHHIQKMNRCCQSEKHKKKSTQKKADDGFIVCKHCVGWFVKWGDYYPTPFPGRLWTLQASFILIHHPQFLQKWYGLYKWRPHLHFIHKQQPLECISCTESPPLLTSPEQQSRLHLHPALFPLSICDEGFWKPELPGRFPITPGRWRLLAADIKTKFLLWTNWPFFR